MIVQRSLTAVLTAFALIGLASCGGGGSDDDSGDTGNDPAATPTFTIGGTVSGLYGQIELQLNGASTLIRDDAREFSFNFEQGLATDTAYTVSANADQQCNITNGSGRIVQANVSNVVIVCTSVLRSGVLSGVQANPSVTSPATARAAIIVNPVTSELTGGLTYSGLTPTTNGYHIHQAPAGDPTGSGPMIVQLKAAPDGQTLYVPAGTTVNSGQYAALAAGEWYVDIHTDAHPEGEIRGQLDVQGGLIGALASLDGNQPVPSSGSAALGGGTLILDATTLEVLVGYATYLDLPTATDGQLLSGGAIGENGNTTLISMTPGNDVFTAPMPGAILTDDDVDALRAGQTYYSIGSSDFPAGEIRGQLIAQ